MNIIILIDLSLLFPPLIFSLFGSFLIHPPSDPPKIGHFLPPKWSIWGGKMVNFGPPDTQKIPPKPEKWTSGGQISLLRMSKLHRQIHLSDTARGVKTGGGTWSKPADPGMEIICVAEHAKNNKVINKKEQKKFIIKISYSMPDSRRVPTRRLPHTGSLGDCPF